MSIICKYVKHKNLIFVLAQRVGANGFYDRSVIIFVCFTYLCVLVFYVSLQKTRAISSSTNSSKKKKFGDSKNNGYFCSTCKNTLQYYSTTCDGCSCWFDKTCKKLPSQQLCDLSQDHLICFCTNSEIKYKNFNGLRFVLSSLSHVGFYRLQKFVNELDMKSIKLEFSEIVENCEFKNCDKVYQKR